MAGAGYFVFNRIAEGGEYVAVPDVQRLPLAEAVERLAAQGLEFAKPNLIVSELVPANYVLAQRPAPGKVVRSGRKIHLTVSSGHDRRAAPELVGKPLPAARQEIVEKNYREGTTAHVPNPAPADTVLAQDPPPGGDILAGAPINLLVSAGEPHGPLLMPDITGKPVQTVSQILDPLGVQVLPIKQTELDGEYDVVLMQTPEAGSLLTETQVVTYEYRPSGLVNVPNARRKLILQFVGPDVWAGRELRVNVIDRTGSRIVFPSPEDYEQDRRPVYLANSELKYENDPSQWTGELTVEVYIDGHKARAYRYVGDAEPIVTEYDDYLRVVGDRRFAY
jgi:beta-lactam-binding protein with PASTA domain